MGRFPFKLRDRLESQSSHRKIIEAHKPKPRDAQQDKRSKEHNWHIVHRRNESEQCTKDRERQFDLHVERPGLNQFVLFESVEKARTLQPPQRNHSPAADQCKHNPRQLAKKWNRNASQPSHECPVDSFAKIPKSIDDNLRFILIDRTL